MIGITFFCPYHGLKSVIERVLDGRPDRRLIESFILTTKTGELPPPDEIPSSTDVIVARGFTAQLVKGFLSIPCIEFKLSGFDVLSAVNKARIRFNAKRIAIVGTYSMTYGAESISSVFPDISILSYTIEQPSFLSHLLQSICTSEVSDVVLGGRSVYEIAGEMGFPCILIETGEESVSLAIDEAVRSVQIHRTERQRSDRFEAILEYTTDGIISVDSNMSVLMLNQYAERLLGHEMIGRSIEPCIEGFDINAAMKGTQPVLGEICHIGGRDVTLNFIPLPSSSGSFSEYVMTFQPVESIQRIEDKIRNRLKSKGFIAKYTFEDIIGKSEAMREAKETARRLALSDANVLIEGETGAEKELFAQSIHSASRRAKGPFVAVNCAALPENLLESELFGYVEGAFTGSRSGGKAGLFELAHKGTIFLDEIGEIPLPLQARLLRVLQEKEVMRLGNDRITPIDVRIIAATNRNLAKLVAEGKFRSDLLYRLNVLSLVVPPLRKHIEDVPELLSSFLRREVSNHSGHVISISKEAIRPIMRHTWPGNVRELRNFAERLSVFSDSETADRDDVIKALGSNVEEIPQKEETEAEMIARILAAHEGSRKKTAAELGIDSSTLYRRMKKYGLC